MMPAKSVESSPGNRVLVFLCDACGAPACCSEGANIREALRSGDQQRAGVWFCGWRDGGPVCVGKAK